MWECVDSFCTGQKGIYELNEHVLQFGSVYCEEAAASSQGFKLETCDIVTECYDPRPKTPKIYNLCSSVQSFIFGLFQKNNKFAN